MAIKCKGCNGTIEHVPLAQVAPVDKFHAGPAIVHDPAAYCQWFADASAQEILAYINVVEYKVRQEANNASQG